MGDPCYLGRLDPATGEVTEWQSPGGPRSEPDSNPVLATSTVNAVALVQVK